MRSIFRTMMLSGCASLVLGAVPAGAETLQEALAAAYDNNPTLAAARSGQRATDEGVPIARADGLPAVNATVGYTEDFIIPSNNTFSPNRLANGQAQISIPLYQGGTVRNSVRAAATRVEAGQARLRDTEQSVFSQVVGAYMDVLRDEAVVSLNRNNVDVLTVNLTATRDRFDIGDLTRTDVAQSEARLARAQSQLESAQATLIRSRENYIALVGHAPENLEPPAPLPNLPEAVDDAVDIAIAENPDLEAAHIDAQAAGYDVRSARGSRYPRVSLTSNIAYTNYLGSLSSGIPGRTATQTQTSSAGGVSVTIPIFQGGRPSARVRQAQARQSQALETAIGTERSVISQTRAAFANWKAAQAVATSSQTAVQANQLSLEGVRAENSVGTRTILDILDAEQELLNSQVQLVTARRDTYVAGFTLLASMGRAEAKDIGIDGGPLYDPALNYERVRDRIWDFDDDPTPVAHSTRTANSPAQTAVVPPGGEMKLAQ